MQVPSAYHFVFLSAHAQAIEQDVAVRVCGSYHRAIRRPLGIEQAAMALAIDVIQEVGHTNALIDVPQEHLAIVAGGEEDMLIPGVGFQHIQLVLVAAKDAVQLG